ncbi:MULTISPECIES: TetR/AcrR family transcriptional regulator C-terminal domain-containing protein, partial [unclassified Rhizobium]|uniref:TetR/AcrR family transcriptional regulator C-terminal domain-containing protein n=1 Tax=unclassified Rhizobium TaxID=2613769 RepID=UPI0011750568
RASTRSLKSAIRFSSDAYGQYLDLCSGSFFKLRLFGTMNAPPEDVEIERVIRGAVKTFLAAYGSKPT